MILALLASAVLSGPAETRIRVEGEGYLRFAREGRIVYTRAATLAVANGRIEGVGGAVAIPLMEAPSGTTQIQVDADGTVHATIQGKQKALGQFMIAVFANPGTLQESNGYWIAKSRPTLHQPGDGTAGLIATGNTIVNSSRQTSPSTAVKPVASGKFRLTLPETVEISGSRILLESIATFEGPVPESIHKLDIGPTPAAGNPLRYQTIRLKARLKSLGYKDEQFDIVAPEVIVIAATGQVVTPEMFLEAARKATGLPAESASALQADTTIEGFTAPTGKLELKVESTQSSKSAMAIRIGVFVDGRRINSKTINLVGDSLAIVIKSGEAVKVRLIAQGIAVEAIGTAKKEARLGETIEVTIQLGDSSTKTTHLARVIGPGTVEIKLP